MKTLLRLALPVLLLSTFHTTVNASEPSSRVQNQRIQQQQSGDAEAIRGVIEKLNLAITNGQTDQLLQYFADGSVKVDLFKAHSYSKVTGPVKITSSDLAQRWKTVIPMLKSSASNYIRTASNIDVRIDGDMAVAWAQIDTQLTPAVNAEKIRTNTFIEMVLLKRIDQEWRVALLSNNRHD